MTTIALIKQSELKQIETRFVKLVGQKKFELEASFAMQLINKSPKLLECDRSSLIAAVFNVAQFGLTLNPVKKEAYIVPRYIRNRGMQAFLEPSYQGLIKAMTEIGNIQKVFAYCVYEGDVFSPHLGTNPRIDHVPKYKSKTVVAAYAVVQISDGVTQIEIMPIDDLNKVRDTSTSWQAFKAGKIATCIWNDWSEEMYRKTVIRRIAKYAPKKDNDRLAELIAADETDYAPDWNMLEYAYQLVRNSTYDHDAQANIEHKIDTMSKPELDNFIIDLQRHQKPLSEVVNPTQKMISEMAQNAANRDSK